MLILSLLKYIGYLLGFCGFAMAGLHILDPLINPPPSLERPAEWLFIYIGIFFAGAVIASFAQWATDKVQRYDPPDDNGDPDYIGGDEPSVYVGQAGRTTKQLHRPKE